MLTTWVKVLPDTDVIHLWIYEYITQRRKIFKQHTKDNGDPFFEHNNHNAYNDEILVVCVFDNDHNIPNQEDLEYQISKLSKLKMEMDRYCKIKKYWISSFLDN